MSVPSNEPITVLHVDDDPDFLELAGTFLERENDRLAVHTAPTVSDGLTLLAELDIDCIVSDYEMPDANGIEFLDSVRDTRPELPFILFTGKGSEEVASEAITAGVSDYLQKESGTDQYHVLANRIVNTVERHRAEQLVQRAFEAMDQSREGMALLDDHGEFIYVNNAYIDIVGYEREELIGAYWELVYPDEQASRIAQNILQAVPDYGHWSGDTVYERKDGSRLRVDHALTYSEQGTMICLVREVSDADAPDQALFEERQRFDLLVDAVDEYAIFMLDPDGYIISWNQGAERIKGYSEDEILGEHFSVFYTDKQRAAGLPERLLDRAISEGSVDHEGPRVRKDGSTFQAAVVITTIYDEDGEHRGFGKVTRATDH